MVYVKADAEGVQRDDRFEKNEKKGGRGPADLFLTLAPASYNNERTYMRKLVRGIVDFRQNMRPTCKDTFAQLALGQRPDTLFIACSDSRVVPNLFASSDPGDLFVVRNVGNLIPPCDRAGRSTSDESEAAAIEFALLNLPVSEIIVCGHSECGAMRTIAEGTAVAQAPNLMSWLRHGKEGLQKLESGCRLGHQLARHNQLSQLNVLEQIEHLKTYPVVRERVKEGRLRLHGWWFDIKEADVYEYDEGDERFNLIDEDYARVLIDRANRGTVSG
jgi:carbonic anhydrase